MFQRLCYKGQTSSDMWTLSRMKATKFFILICFLAFSGRFQAAGSFFSNLMSGHFSDDDSEYEDNSESHSVSTSDEEYYGYSDDDLPHPIDKDGLFGLLSKNASALYEYWTSNTSNVGTEVNNIPRTKRFEDQIVISTGAEEDEEIEGEIIDQNPINKEKEDEEKEAELTEEIALNNDQEIPTADPIANNNIVEIPAEHVHHFDDSIVSANPNDYDSDNETLEISFPNELKEKTVKNQNLNINNFIEKAAHFKSYDEARRNLRSKAVTTSKSHQKVLNLLQDSYMGEFDFSSVESIDVPAEKTKIFKDKLLKNYSGEVWMNMNWKDLTENEFDKQVLKQLNALAPETMTNLPSLAPKTTYERDVLEDWLIGGLLAAYPTLTVGVTKNDAIALVILAVLSKSYTKPENNRAIAQLFSELEKYIGDLPNKFPLDQFTFNSDESKEEGQRKHMETLLKIIKEGKLSYATKVIEDILSE